MANDIYEVNFIGKTNWINGKNLKCNFNKSYEQLLKKNENSLMELYLMYDANLMKAKTNVLSIFENGNSKVLPFTVKDMKEY